MAPLSRRFVVWVFALALALRVLYISVAVDNSTIGSWLDAGPDISLHLLRGQGYVSSWDICQNFRSFRTPGWPLTLWAIWSVFGYSVLVPKLFLAALSALSCVFVALLGAHLFDARVGRLAGLLAAFCTTLIRWTGTLGMETLAVFCITLGVYWVCVPPARLPASWRFVPAGLALGLLCLTRPLWMAYVALVVLALLLNRREREPRTAVGVLAATVFLVMLPWVARNALVHHRLVVASTDGGLAFMEANNPRSFRQHGDWIPGYAASLPDVRRRLPLSEAGFNEWMMRKGIDYIRAEPLLFAQVYVLRLGYLWKPSPPAQQTVDLSRKHLLWMTVWWSACYTFMLAGFVLKRPWKDEWQWPVLLVLLWASLAIPLFSNQLRYRAPLEPFTLLYGAAGWFALVDWRRNRLQASNERRRK